MKSRILGVLLPLLVSSITLPLLAGQVEVINEDFEGGLPAGAGVVNNANGNVFVGDDGSGFNNVLMLTQNVFTQAGWVWFPDQFDLNNSRVEVEFDLFIGRADTGTPADGVSVIFQFDEDLGATGDAGGGLGVGNLNGIGGAYEYVSVGFDIWDNGAVDDETPCDGVHGADGASTCHVEVNQNIDPENVASQVQGPSPDYVTSAAVYGSPDPLQNTGVETFDPADLIHVTIIFDNRLMVVIMEGGIADDGLSPFPRTRVIDFTTEPFPDRLSNIGFAASTGGRIAWQWIDNLVVREGPSMVSLVSEGPRTSGAMNCGGGAVDATAEIGIAFEADSPVGTEVARDGDVKTGVTITTSSFGRAAGANVGGYDRPIDVSQIAGAGPLTEEIFKFNRWDNGPVSYVAEVEPGRYDVTLFFAEDFAGAVNLLGQGTKVVDVSINGEKVLCNWSAAAAAGSPTQSGDPNAPCTAVLDTGIARSFAVDVTGDSLNVTVHDLGGGNPPENATLNALSFQRTGDATGEPTAGDIECSKRICIPPDGTHVAADFEADTKFTCPAGWACNGNNFTPQVVAGRLRLTDDLIGSTGTTAWVTQSVDVLNHCLEATFEVYMENPDGAGDPAAADLEAADGAAFLVMQGTNTAALGPGGGSMGIPGGVGFAVEFDTWRNGGATMDSSGFNTANTWTHVGINDLSINSIITNTGFDPDLRPVSAGGTGWPNFFDPEGVRVSVTYESGSVSVELEGVTEDGSPFGPTVVAEANVYPVQESEALVGFAAGTGGRTQNTDVDNVAVEASAGIPDPNSGEAQVLARARDRWADGTGALYINCGGPTLACTGNENPAPITVDAQDTGAQVVWVGDTVGGGVQVGSENEFFRVVPIPNQDGSNSGLQVATTNMGNWDARGTEAGIDDNDRIFHSERWADMQYEIPVPDGEYEVTLYFANSFSGTSGTALRFFHIDVEGERQGGFEHCEYSGRPIGDLIPNPVFGFDELYDPVDAADQFYGPFLCGFGSCSMNGVTVQDDPDQDRIQADRECGNAAAVAVRVGSEKEGGVLVSDGVLEILLTEPDVLGGEPPSPDSNPKISGISIRRTGGGGGQFIRADSNADGGRNIADPVYLLNNLFGGGPPCPCLESCDVNDDGGINIADPVYHLNNLFGGGPPVPPPGPDCGGDPDNFTPVFECAEFPPCA